MKTSLFLSFAVIATLMTSAGCTSSGTGGDSSWSLAPQSDVRSGSEGLNGGGGRVPVQPSLKSLLNSGGTLLLIIRDTKLATNVNDRMGKDLVLIQHGKETIQGNDISNYCQVGSDSGCISIGDHFELKSKNVTDKVYLAAT